ncbi:MAG: ATP-dependent DNA ligase [Cyanobacteria bacterium SZAS TMP-1]|nr:ATP-dependent DNA ligase [Cyanobacteria bacterium SZAS TMP-1]
MKRFVELYLAIDATTKTSGKLSALKQYFLAASPEDAAWAIFFLTGRKLKRLVPTANLRKLTTELAGLSDWMFQECYDSVGDLAETMALLAPEKESVGEDLSLSQFVQARVLTLRDLDDDLLKHALTETWSQLDVDQKFVFNKLITGGFRVGVSQQLVINALALVSGLESSTIAHRLMGEWQPTAAFYLSLVDADAQDSHISRPYPFYLAHPIAEEPSSLGDISEWLVEWKWDGIRAQIIKRGGQVFIWSRGEELVTERFPELAQAGARLPDGTVLDGEILAFHEGDVLPFAKLQMRIGRKSLSKKILAEVPVAFMAFDLLECDGQDLRATALEVRREKLTALLTPGACDMYPSCRDALSQYLRVSSLLDVADWPALAAMQNLSRSLKVEGVMLKRRGSIYGVGRKRGDWWKWKIDPLSIDAVLINAQRGHGRRATLYTDYTFGVWDQGKLVPIAKAYSGLTDEEINKVDAYVRKNTLEKFGPVRTVKPGLVMEIAFEGIQYSPRHKSGIAVRFPRIARLREDKPIEEADSLLQLKSLLPLGREGDA